MANPIDAATNATKNTVRSLSASFRAWGMEVLGELKDPHAKRSYAKGAAAAPAAPAPSKDN